MDVVALLGLEWIYDKVEDRYGRLAAWFVTIGLAALILGAVVVLIIAAF